jgi:hypothetical protein
MDLYMLESQVSGRMLWERQSLLELPSAQRRIRLRRELELQRRLTAASRVPAWRIALHGMGDRLIVIGERLRSGAPDVAGTPLGSATDEVAAGA